MTHTINLGNYDAGLIKKWRAFCYNNPNERCTYNSWLWGNEDKGGEPEDLSMIDSGGL